MQIFGQRLGGTRKITYMALMVAVSVVANLFSFKIAGVISVSFVNTSCFLAGFLFGPIYGFAIAFLGDGLAFLFDNSGFAYSPFIGLLNGIFALICGLVYMKKSGNSYVKALICFIIGYVICTLLISSLTVYFIFGTKSTFWAVVVKRIIFQSPVTICNLILSLALLKTLLSIKPLKSSC